MKKLFILLIIPFLSFGQGFGDSIEFYACFNDGSGPIILTSGDLPGNIDGNLAPYGGITDGFCGGPYYYGYSENCSEQEILSFQCYGGPLYGNNFITNESFESIEGGFIGDNTYPSAYEMGIMCDYPTPTIQNYQTWLQSLVNINTMAPNTTFTTTNTTLGFNAGKFTFLPEWTEELLCILTTYDIYSSYEEALIAGCDPVINNCASIIELNELSSYMKSLIRTMDILGRETTNKGFQLYIYDDGSVEKKYVIK
tara:strand:- start:23 stop:784 length:762 start_codon:yes stop_codon:yes gene_type:complete